MNERVKELGLDGKSHAQMAADLDISRKCMWQWQTNDKLFNPENGEKFGSALARATDLALAWWDEKGQKGVDDRNVNSGMFKIGVSARFPDVYRERQEVVHSGEIATDKPLDARQTARAVLALLQAGVSVPILAETLGVEDAETVDDDTQDQG
jgi:hypothetical protein